ncbi:uncharacterized protein LOC131487029 isoform X3 [Neofelis nebulosa]|uniref:uncharacterized protein LOC131487029 isoform X3 n=1 Tax=Neofelis nebulosa TaxID=61452 RepID=UPI00272A7365|nr:uncharacterized protein LOC131487029 isoform X3 [Neofelis nebulosa]XP_058543270.1 uncharacterized protein LOC131487029 isoform X3 [Neofelis nebulosa]
MVWQRIQRGKKRKARKERRVRRARHRMGQSPHAAQSWACCDRPTGARGLEWGLRRTHNRCLSKKLGRKQMLSPAEKFLSPPKKLHPHNSPPHTHKVKGTTPAFPRWGSLCERLLVLQDFPARAQAPPSPERVCCPPAKRQPEQRLGGGGEWAPLAAIGCAGRRGGGRPAVPPTRRPRLHSSCARRPPVRSGSSPHAAPDFPADGFAGADRRDPGACEELGAALVPPGVPERGRGGRSVPTRRARPSNAGHCGDGEPSASLRTFWEYGAPENGVL